VGADKGLKLDTSVENLKFGWLGRGKRGIEDLKFRIPSEQGSFVRLQAMVYGSPNSWDGKLGRLSEVKAVVRCGLGGEYEYIILWGYFMRDMERTKYKPVIEYVPMLRP